MSDQIDRHQIRPFPAAGRVHAHSANGSAHSANMNGGHAVHNGVPGKAGISFVNRKRIGDYLIEAGLLTKSQVDVALNDQQTTEMKFGEILAARGWVKQQTIEFVMTKVVVPERKTLAQRERVHQMKASSDMGAVDLQSPQESQPQNGRNAVLEKSSPASSSVQQNHSQQNSASGRRDAPISKPLPPVKSNDGDVNWVG
jgi:hypothetical protein